MVNRRKPSCLFLVLLEARGWDLESVALAGIPTLPLLIFLQILRLENVVSDGLGFPTSKLQKTGTSPLSSAILFSKESKMGLASS